MLLTGELCVWGAGGICEFSVPYPQFFCEPKTTQNNEANLKKNAKARLDKHDNGLLEGDR